MDTLTEDYPHGVTCTRKYDGRLIMIEGDYSSVEAINSWSNAVMKIIDEIPIEGPIFLIDDLSSLKEEFMAHAVNWGRKNLVALPRYRNQMYMAVVLSGTFMNRIGSILLKQIVSWNSKIEYKVFVSRKEANAWIMEQMKNIGFDIESSGLDNF
ncbi:MAG: hypothetical protein SFZ02_04910 [bacterium]|nr:hypothetical protein [bacterium]